MSNLLAPNGKPSNLTNEQWHLVRTPAFISWFGDWENDPESASKVVDENGEPLVVYHGTNLEFNEFDYSETQKNDIGFVGKGFYFTPKKTLALAYAERQHERFMWTDSKEEDKSKVIVKSFFLSIKTPKVVNEPKDIGINYYKSEIGDKLEKEKIVKISDYLKKQGYQGIIWHRDNCNGCLNGRKNWEYVAFEPTQIKLADGTNTTFDGNNPDIRFDGGGNVLLAPNGKPSNLTPEQYKLVRTPAFISWFGNWEKKQFLNKHKPNSTIYLFNTISLDENGEPRIWCRATHYQYNIIESEYIYLGAKKSYVKQYGIPKEFFVKADKTIFIDNQDIERKKLGIKFDYLAEYISDENEIPRAGKNYEKLKDKFKNQKDVLSVWEYFTFLGNEEIIELFKGWFSEYGFDSIMYWETGLKNNFQKYPIGLISLYFGDEYLKLADGTNTTFDGSNPDIRFDEGGGVKELSKKEKQEIISNQNKFFGDGLPTYKLSADGNWVMKLDSRTNKYKTYNRFDLFHDNILEQERVMYARENAHKVFEYLDSHGAELLNKSIYGSRYYIYKNNRIRVSNHHNQSEQKNEGGLNKYKHTEHNFYSYEKDGWKQMISEIESLNNSDVRFDEGGSVLLAPNGKPSNLTPEQYKLVRTPAFISWFGDWENSPETSSKVVDENGEPLVVYHGSKNDFNTFSLNYIATNTGSFGFLGVGFYFATNKSDAKNYGEIVKPYFLKSLKKLDLRNIEYKELAFMLPKLVMKNGKTWKDAFIEVDKIKDQIKFIEIEDLKNGFFNVHYQYKDSWEMLPRRTIHEIESDKGLSNIVEKIIEENPNNIGSIGNYFNPEYLSKVIKNEGFDSIISNGTNIYDLSDEVVVFEPNQIKLADGTNTTFDGNNPDIRFDGGGSTLLAPNGKPSNLTPEQYKLVRTPAFISWFGDWENDPKNASKVVDENGEPLVVYHGTSGDLFYEFMPFAIEYYNGQAIKEFRGNRTNEEFDKYIKTYGLRKIPTRFWFSTKHLWGNKFLACFLNIKNIFLTEEYEPKLPIEFDGFRVPNEDGVDYFCVSKSEQIKLADGTNTTFDGNNPDIRFDGGGSTLLAPNGKPSNLTPEQYKLVRTPAFISWFGDWEKLVLTKINDSGIDEVSLKRLEDGVSKVVDENGEPLVVLHGTKSFDIYEFELSKSQRKSSGLKEFGTYFTDNKTLAEAYRNWSELKPEVEKEIDIQIQKWDEIQDKSRNNRDYENAEKQIKLLKEKKRGKIYNVFLNLKKVKVFDAEGNINTEAWNNLKVKASYKTATNRDAMEFLKEGKFGVEKVDGIKATNIVDAFVQTEKLKKELLSNVYLVFDSENIKLADGTNTTFDGNNPDIRYNGGGALQDELHIVIKGVTNENKYKGNYKKIFDLIDGNITFYNPYGTSFEELKGNDFHITITPKPETSITEKISKLKDVEIINPDIRFKAGGSVLLAPNGKPSNLTPEQYELVRTPAFISWFGDWENDPATASKVIDENGEPLVVHHGTINGGFNEFNSKTFPTVGYFAEDYNFSYNFIEAKKRFRDASSIKNSMIYEVYLSIKNPIDLTSIKDGYEDISIAEFISHLPYNIDIIIDSWANKNIEVELPLIMYLANFDIIDSFKRNGYDGVKFNEGRVDIFNQYKYVGELDINSVVSWIALYPTQIKLADGTNTTFDGNNPDIRFKEGGKIELNEESQQLVDIISMNPNSDKYQKYKDILLNKFGINFDDYYKDDYYIENANLSDIKRKDDFLNYDKYIEYALKIFRIRGLFNDYHAQNIEGIITIDEAKEIGDKLDFKIINQEYSGGAENYASHSIDVITIPNEVDINTFVHEIGHHYDHFESKEYEGLANTSTYASSLYEIGKSDEVFAENFKNYFIAPKWLKEKLPMVYSELDTNINEKYKKVIFKLIDDIKQKYNYGGQPINKETMNPKDTITMDIPLLIRMLEVAREDIKSDEQLHRLVENIIDLKDNLLTMDDYDEIVMGIIGNEGDKVAEPIENDLYSKVNDLKEHPELLKYFLKHGGQTTEQSNKISKVMHEFNEGKLKTSYGEIVTDPKQAIAIALSEAGIEKKNEGGSIYSTNYDENGKISKIHYKDGDVKLSLESYWYEDDEGVELVPVSELVKFREFNRLETPKWNQEESNRNINNLKNNFMSDGVKEPLIIEYNQEDKMVLLVEGNHRLNSAVEMGLEYLPARVRLKKYGKYKGNTKKSAMSVKGVEPNQFGYISSALKPSQVGINSSMPLKYEEGGIIEGQLHSECNDDDGCGVKFQVGSGGTQIEAERDEAVIVSEAFNSTDKYTIRGTCSQIASALNIIGGGKNFDKGATIMTSNGSKLNIPKMDSEAKDTDVESQLESGSIIINRRSMADSKVYSVSGTTRQIASAINSMNGNGVVIEAGAEVE